MKSWRPGVIALAGFFVALLLMRYSSDRPQREKLVIGTWFNRGMKLAHQPIVLHVFSDHTYKVESSNYHILKAGSWRLSGFPNRGLLILDSYHLGTDTHSDGKLALDLVARSMSDSFGSGVYDPKYLKESEDPEMRLTAQERFTVGAWTNNLDRSNSAHSSCYFLSDHRFGLEFEFDGKWRIDGSKVIVDWIDDEDHKPHSASFMMNAANGTMKGPGGQTFIRTKLSD